MRLIHLLSAAALAAVPTFAFAQSAATDQPDTTASAPPAAGAATSGPTSASSSAKVTTGLPVKDKSGATIGSVASVKTDGSGNQVATIKMGADQFAVDTSAVAVENGAVVINATQAEIKAMLPKHK